VDLLIHDELGFIPLGELVEEKLSERNETRLTLLTTNLSFREWVQVFGDEKRTIALLDRLVRHAHVLTTRGESYRTRKRRRKEERKVAP
jgi:DNA replication protein DnaC